jgi:di/tricarboxylate transporter
VLLLAYETGYYSAADVRRLGIGMLLLTVIVILLTIPYWRLLSASDRRGMWKSWV